MTEEQRIQQQLAQLSHERQQLKHRARQLRQHYRRRSKHRLARADAIVAAGLTGAASYWLVSQWRHKNGAKGAGLLGREIRVVVLELLDRQCKRWIELATQRFRNEQRDQRNTVATVTNQP